MFDPERDLIKLSDQQIQDIIAPQWGEGGKVHNWHNHVPAYVQERWKSLTVDAKLCIYVMAETQADREVWD